MEGHVPEMAGKPRGAPRLDRNEWLMRALDALARKGDAALTIDALCKALNVTKGSFYWHFKDRDDFIRNLVQFWGALTTDPVIERVTQTSDDAKERLRTLLRLVSEGGYAKYDVSVRAWAARNPNLVVDLVSDVDQRRLTFVASIFTAIGFDAVEAETRARAAIAFLTFEALVLVPSTANERAIRLDRFFAMLTRS